MTATATRKKAAIKKDESFRIRKTYQPVIINLKNLTGSNIQACKYAAAINGTVMQTVPVPFNFDYRGEYYEGVGIPVMFSCDDGVCQQLDITLNKKHLGVIKCNKNGWHINGAKHGVINAIGDQIFIGANKPL